MPIDSDAEEVHALGLKKFVEEAKLLWNLSTPTRHPNIVNVYTIFEENNTAYMVLEFEEGQSLKAWLLALGRRPSQGELDDITGALQDAEKRKRGMELAGLMTEAAQHSGRDPDRVSFVAALRITRQTIAQPGEFPP